MPKPAGVGITGDGAVIHHNRLSLLSHVIMSTRASRLRPVQVSAQTMTTQEFNIFDAKSNVQHIYFHVEMKLTEALY